MARQSLKSSGGEEGKRGQRLSLTQPRQQALLTVQPASPHPVSMFGVGLGGEWGCTSRANPNGGFGWRGPQDGAYISAHS